MEVTKTYNTLFIQPSREGIRSEIKRKYLFIAFLMIVVMIAVAGIACLDGGIDGTVILTFLMPGIVVFGAYRWTIIPMVEQKCILIRRDNSCIYVNDALQLPIENGSIGGFSIKGKKVTFRMNRDYYLKESLELYPDIETTLYGWLHASKEEFSAEEITNITYFHLTLRGILTYIRDALTEKLEYADHFYNIPEKEQERLKEQNKKHALWYLFLLNGIPFFLIFIGIVSYIPNKNIFDSFQQGIMWIIFGFYFAIIQSYSLMFLPALQKILQHTEDNYNRKRVKRFE